MQQLSSLLLLHVAVNWHIVGISATIVTSILIAVSSSILVFGRPLQVISATGPLCLSVTLVYCGQMVGCIKMPLGTEVGLGPGDIVTYGDPVPPSRKGAQQSPHFLAHVYCGQTVAHLSNCWALVLFHVFWKSGTGFLWAGCPSCLPINSVEELEALIPSSEKSPTVLILLCPCWTWGIGYGCLQCHLSLSFDCVEYVISSSVNMHCSRELSSLHWCGVITTF